MSSGSTDSSIMTISELIDSTFGNADVNIVHHKFLQSILYLLARQLRVLERRVVVKLGQIDREQSASSISVTELKLLAINKKTKTFVETKAKQLQQTPIDNEQTSVETTSKSKTVPTRKQEGVSDKEPSESKPYKSSDKTSSDKKSRRKKLADKSSTAKAPSSSEEDLSDRASSAKKSEEAGSLASKKRSQSSDKSQKLVSATSDKSDLQEYQQILETVEQMRERELRVIRQRVHSRDAPEKTPTPMASMDSVEANFEKLLVVERVPLEEAKARAAREKSGRGIDSKTQLSIVTKEQFDELSSMVQQLQQKFGPIASADFPENARLMEELRKGASLTDAMAALQLSARLEAVERALKTLLSLVTDLASESEADLKFSAPNTESPTDDIEVLFGAAKEKIKAKKEKSKSKLAKGSKKDLTVTPEKKVTEVTQLTSGPGEVSEFELKRDRVTRAELENALQEINDQIMKQVNIVLTRNSASADTAVKLATSLESKIKASLNLGRKMEEVENLVANFADQINVLDTGLTSQMTNYQEELTQMQHDLECGLENMAEMMANTGSDATAVAELNTHFTNLQFDIDNTVMKQKELRETQYELAADLEGLRRQIELLRETKSDREEVADALRDKAGIGDLNGLTTCEQFNAVRGDFESRIAMAYDKFNNQETVWQKALDDFQRELNEKADNVHVDGLRKEINRHLDIMTAKTKLIADIVGEPSAAAISKELKRGAACLCCYAPAHMNIDKPELALKLPAFRPTAIGTEAPKPKEDGDHVVCIPGRPIPHPRDPRGHVCNRWCGGSHTLLTNTPMSRVPPSMIITPVNRDITLARGTDGKMYMVDEPEEREPCLQCAIPEPGNQPEPEVASVAPFHMCPYFDSTLPEEHDDATPPTMALESE